MPHRGTPEGNLSILRGDTSVFFTFYNASGDLVESGKVLADAAQKKRFAVLGVELVGSTPEAFDRLIAYDAERFGKIFKPEANSVRPPGDGQ